MNKETIIPEKTTFIPPFTTTTTALIIPMTLPFQYHFISIPSKTTLQTEGEQVRDKGKKAISHEKVAEKESKKEIENQKGIKQAKKVDVVKSEINKGKQDLIDLVGLEVVEKMYRDKVKYNKYCLKMLNGRDLGKITNCNMLSRGKGPITLKKEVMHACPKRTGAGWTTIFTQMRQRLDALHKAETELELDLTKPLEEQDPILKLNVLLRIREKMLMTFMTTSSLLKGTRSQLNLVTFRLGLFSMNQL
ncbi:hypothetical protein Tco_0185731 [Tanacetum coccineum]